MKKALFAVFLILALTLTAFAAPVSAKIPTSSQYNRVAIVPNQYFCGGSEGMLPESHSDFANFTFTNLPIANLTAGNLTNFDIVVLVIDDCDWPQPTIVTPQQASDINAWVFNGGKLIIYDSEMPPQDYSWLVYPFNTTNPGAYAYTGSIVLMEDNTLGEDNDPVNTFYYINTTVDQDGNNWEDAIGDGNLFTTFDIHWCGDIEAINGEQSTGWMHAYAQYGDGLMIYNGFDMDPIYDMGGNGTAPSANGYGALAKIFLLELAQPWADDYNLPCGNPIVVEKNPSVGGYVLGSSFSAYFWIPVALAIVLALATAVMVRRNRYGLRT